jgi:aminoglycoside phosphotransferase (APT) family kinase protein
VSGEGGSGTGTGAPAEPPRPGTAESPGGPPGTAGTTGTGGPAGAAGVQRSGRDPAELGDRLERWLATRLPAGARPVVEEVAPTAATGMSSETLLMRAVWTGESGRRRAEDLVVRLEPREEDVPVFPRYDLGQQFEVLRTVAALTRVPVPRVWWHEPDPGAVGSPFFVMSRVEGRVPPDVMPYNFGDSWLFDLPPGEQRALQDATVALLAELHAIDRPEERFAVLRSPHPGDTPLRRHVAKTRHWYAAAAADGGRSALVEEALAWLEDHWPDEGPAVLSWGDARIGNVLYQGTRPAGVLDWEMAGLGPRELDVAWLIWGHRNFEDIAADLGLPGMPGFLRRDDVVATYQQLTGHELTDLDFYLAYAAVQFGIVYLRVGRRAVHFGERPPPDDPDDLLYNRGPLERLVAGTYWSDL